MCIVDDLKFIKKCLDDGMHATVELMLNDAIMQAEQQEPVAWLPPDPPPECSTDAEKTAFAFGWFKALESQRLSSSSPKREWQGLTDEEIDTWNIVGHESLREFVRSIEAKLKEKNT